MTKKIIHFDWAFKKLLRQKANYAILEGFLSVLLKINIRIKNIVDSESNKGDNKDKYNRVDIFAEIETGELIIVELQIESEIDYFQRMAYGTSKAITEYINEGEKYIEVKKVYSVNIVYFELGQGKDYVYHGTTEFRGLHEKDILQLSDRQLKTMPKYRNVNEIFPEYYVLKVNEFDDYAKDSLDEWIYVLKNSEVKDEFKAKGLKEIKEKLNYENMSEEEKARYNAYLGHKSVDKSTVWSARMEEKVEMAIKLRNMGMKIDDIREVTGLTNQEIEKL